MDRFRKTFPVILLYAFLIIGAIRNIQGLNQTVMSFIAGPLIIVLALVAWYALRRSLDSRLKTRFDLYTLFVFAGGFAVEWVGVKTGMVFGVYSYGDMLQPQLDHVPLAIGFAWVLMLFSSHALAQLLIPDKWYQQTWIMGVAIGGMMMVFDILMEPAAIALDYWQWPNGLPIQNFVAWFVLGAGFAFVGYRLNILQQRAPRSLVHLWLAQAIYFIIVWIGM